MDEDIVRTIWEHIEFLENRRKMSILKYFHKNKDKDLKILYLEFYNIHIPKCVCGKDCKFINLKKGFDEFCSFECKDKHNNYTLENIILKIRNKGFFFSKQLEKIRKYHELNDEELFLLAFNDSEEFCPICGNKLKFGNLNTGYLGKTCSQKCGVLLPRRKLTSEENEIKQLKRRLTTFEKYGVDNNLQLLDKNGDNNPQRDFKIRQKTILTLIENYGGPSPFNSKEIRDKSVDTKILKYGDANFSNYDKARTTMVEKYGVEFAMQSQELKDKFAKSRSENFQNRMTEIGLSGFVYCLFFEDLDLIKIGLTNNTNARFNALRRDFGRFHKIFVFFCENCYLLEKYFHNMFKSYNVVIEHGCGRTEFFKTDIINIMKDIRLSV